MKKKAIITLLLIVFISILGGAAAVKADEINSRRALFIWYVVDKTNPNPALRLCTKSTMTAYTTNEADKAPGAATIITNLFAVVPVLATICPTIAIFVAL